MKNYNNLRINNKKIMKKGIALISVILILVVLFILGLAILSYVGGDFLFAGIQRNSLSALYLAQAGIIYTALECSSWQKFPHKETEKLATGRFIIEADLLKDNTIDLISRGEVGEDTVRPFTRTLRAKLSRQGYIIEWYP
ncbi:MAG: pilus assembly PilX N-terminal domain-containing protein [Armatimonadetes bacterium]|nr:pilus assembly PilX N-terminal domain-containing protein [Armatimonadota bacterium]